MPKFSTASEKNLAEVHPRLQELFQVVVKHFDCTIDDGARTVEEQRKNVAKGVSKTMNSKHIIQDDGFAHAVDARPYPLPSWAALERGLTALKRADSHMEVARFYAFTGFVAGVAAVLDIPIRQGVDWDGDRDYGDHTFIDLPHTELKDD